MLRAGTFVTFFLLAIAVMGQQPEKLYYDKEWKPVKNQDQAEFYRLITLDNNGKPVGVVRDFYITGELQWEGTLSHFDRVDDSKSVQQGKCTWFYKSGKKSRESTYVNGKLQGPTTGFHENGRIKDEVEFLDGKPHGIWLVYYENGRLESKVEYQNGKLAGKWFVECDEFEKCQSVFSDSFQTAENEFGWKLAASSNISPKKGIVVKGNSQTSSTQFIYLPIDISRNFSIETVINFSSGDTNSGNGLIYGFRDWDNYYSFHISPNGYYRISTVKEGLQLELVKWTQSRFINQNVNRNLVKISKIGDKVYFSINRQIVESLDFYRFTGNFVGLHSLPAFKELTYERVEVRQDTEPPAGTGRVGSSTKWKGNGSGIFIDNRGYIATNYHVVDGISEIQVEFLRDGIPVSHKGKVVVSDRQNDLSIIRIDDALFRPLTKLPYAFSVSTADVGTNVFALGYPAVVLLGEEIKFTDGKISSRTGYQGDITSYQISVPLQPGNSGGPLFDYEGNLLGIASAKVPALENVSYAIKSSYLSNLIDVVPEKLVLPRDSLGTTKSLTEKIKAISPYVVLIRTR